MLVLFLPPSRFCQARSKFWSLKKETLNLVESACRLFYYSITVRTNRNGDGTDGIFSAYSVCLLPPSDYPEYLGRRSNTCALRFSLHDFFTFVSLQGVFCLPPRPYVFSNGQTPTSLPNVISYGKSDSFSFGNL